MRKRTRTAVPLAFAGAMAGWLAMAPARIDAQGVPDSVPRAGVDTGAKRVISDSAARVRALADSLLLEDDPDDELPATHQSLSVQSLNRSYSVGGTRFAENVGLLTYHASRGAWSVIIGASPLRFSTGATTISGTPPESATIDWRFQPGDTLRIYGRSSSFPAALDSAQAVAIGSIGTSTIDMASSGLGTPGMVGARLAVSFAGENVTFGVRGALEYQPRPDGPEDTYWTGTTVSGGISLGTNGPTTRWTGLVDVTQGFADSLGGRNLFQGGGNVNVELRLNTSFAEASAADGLFSFYYQKPFGNDRNDQPNRLIPVGDSYGLFGTANVPLRSMLLMPTLTLAREASSATTGTAASRYAYSASSWAINAGLALQIPVVGALDLTPEIGGVFGNASATFTSVTPAPFGARRGRPVTSSSGFTNRINGWYLGLQLTVAF